MFWNKVEKLFGNMLFNHTNASTNATSYLEIQRLGYQLVVYASDWAEFTNQSDLGNLSFLVVTNISSTRRLQAHRNLGPSNWYHERILNLKGTPCSLSKRIRQGHARFAFFLLGHLTLS